jgi:hypothetical protein
MTGTFRGTFHGTGTLMNMATILVSSNNLTFWRIKQLKNKSCFESAVESINYLMFDWFIINGFTAYVPYQTYEMYFVPYRFHMSAYLYGGVTQLAPGSIEAAWDTKVASACISVEWTSGEVSRQFQQLDLNHALMMYKFPVVKYYAVAVFLVNCWNSCYSGETSSYFACEPMSLEEYIGLVNWN